MKRMGRGYKPRPAFVYWDFGVTGFATPLLTFLPSLN